jgi:hypothetical protein
MTMWRAKGPTMIIVRPDRNGSASVTARQIVLPFHLGGPSFGNKVCRITEWMPSQPTSR